VSLSSSQERELERDDEHQVTPLELFFDLVFVFAITQVTSLLRTIRRGAASSMGCSFSRRSGGRGSCFQSTPEQEARRLGQRSGMSPDDAPLLSSA
jgi:hypothetical protein